MTRRYKKKELIEIVDTLIEANEYINNLRKVEEETVISLLIQCQETAISIGNYIEENIKDGDILVGYLEAYCESIYQLSITFSKQLNLTEIVGIINEQLLLVRKGIQEKIPEDKKEIVFMPYKVSMWDSLESIWQAAKEDDNYEVYVVPIPYFDKKPDGTLGKMHYEGAEYPKYVPITAWEEYDFKKYKPEAIFIHNPYDNCNQVTSVHPAFYSKKLREYTQKLVYIPYFVCADNCIERQLCVLPGIIYANKVVVQSERIRNIYIEELYKFEIKNKCQGMIGNIEEKIVALGTPKYDKIIGNSKEKINIPDEWKKVINNGNDTKKIVLYNTSLERIIRYSGVALDKIENVLNTFKQYKKDIILLWRPHPLIMATLESMKPELCKRYKEIVERYKSEGWGIFDDTSDVSRAIVLSDAYFGDGGSLLAMYEQTGKPILIQDIEVGGK